MNKIIIEVSARHCHLSAQDLEKLFGVNYQLKEMKPLSQGGEFAAEETISLVTAGGQIDSLRVLGPVREKTQVEITMTEARKLKIKPPVRLSGNLTGSAGGKLIGPAGEIELVEGIIIAQRHVHCDPETAKQLGLSQDKTVAVKTHGERSVIFNDIPVRIKDGYALRLHLDTDEGNASLPGGVCSEGELLS